MEYHTRKSIDIWLNDKGYYRKLVALDETCLFRAVSDQVYNTQIYHDDIRNKCVKYAVEHRDELKDWVEDFDDHIDKLSNHLIICGDLEIEILSRILERDFIIFDSADFTIKNVTRIGYKELIMLCRMKAEHFDSVFKKDNMIHEGFCQSLVYKVLYEKVFKMDNVDSTVDTMLYQSKLTPVEEKETAKLDTFDLLLPKSESKEEVSSLVNSLEQSRVPETVETPPPISYKVAKALDPNQYRNVGYDAWNQERKDMRMKNWYLGGDDFKVGTKCVVHLYGRALTCYIQEMNCGADDVCLVYIVDTAERRKVKLRDLCPHPHARPWPKPYYVSRNKRRTKVTSDDYKEPKDPKKNHYQKKRPPYHVDPDPWLDSSSTSSNYGTLSAASLEGCPFMTSMNNQFTDSFHLDDTMSNVGQYAGPPLLFNNSCEPFADAACNQIVQCDSFNQYSLQSYAAPGDQLAMPLVSSQRPLVLNGLELPLYDIYAWRCNFNLGVECVRQNCWPMCMPPLPGSPVMPFIVPDGLNSPPYMPHMSVATEFNMIHRNSTDTMFMFYSQRIKGNPAVKNDYFQETYNLDNKMPLPELYFDGLPPVEPYLNFVPELPYTFPPPNFNIPLPNFGVPPPNFNIPPPDYTIPLPDVTVPPPNINISPPFLPLDSIYPRVPYPDLPPPPYLAPITIPMPAPIMQYYPIEFAPLPLSPPDALTKKYTKRSK